MFTHDPSLAVTNSQTSVILHTAEDRKTLVRIVGKVQFHLTGNPGAGTIGACNFALVVRPSGVNTVIPVTAQRLDQVKPKNMIMNHMFAQVGSGAVATDAPVVNTIDIDIKGQRMLAEEDEIALVQIGNAATIGQLTFSLSLVFKE